MFKIICDQTVEDFLQNTKPLLYRDEPTHSLMLGLCEGMLASPPKNSPLLIRVVEDQETVSAAIQTPPMNLVLSYFTPAQIECLAKYLKKINANFPGVVGPAMESEVFANAWSQLTGRSNKLAMGQKIYKLESVEFPVGLSGEFRVAESKDLDLVTEWAMAFAKESLPLDPRGEPYWKDYAARSIQNQTAHLWIVEDIPVSIAHATRPTENGVSIGGVYTPPSQRKKGYASGVVAYLSQKMLDSGKKFCVLYTDLANPTSNKIYQNIGYREVADSKHFIFS